METGAIARLLKSPFDANEIWGMIILPPARSPPRSRVLTFGDLGAFEEACKQHGAPVPPYLGFVRRPPSSSLPETPWERIPLSTREKVLPHQKEAIETAVRVHNWRTLVTLGPGTGKTLIATLLAGMQGSRTLILSPDKAIPHWINEYKRWLGRPGPVKLESKKPCPPTGPVICTADALKERKDLLAEMWECVIVDECHCLKGGSSKRSLEIIPLLHRTPAVVLLSGTPQKNSPCELFNLLHALHPAYFSDRRTFAVRYCDGKIGVRGVWEERGATNKEELNLLLRLCMYRNNNVVVVTTKLIRHRIEVIPTEEQKEELAKMSVQLERLNKLGREATTQEAKTRLFKQSDTYVTKMLQTAGKFKAELAESQWLDPVIQAHPGEKIVFFCFHKDIAKRLKVLVETKYGEKVAYVDGNTRDSESQFALLREPEGGAKYGVLTIKACGDAINLQPGVSVVVFVQFSTVPADLEQAEKRAYRMGATKDVSSYWLQLAESRDVTVVEQLQRKYAIAKEVVEGAKKSRIGFE